MAAREQPGRIRGAIFDYGRVLAYTQYQEPRAAWERRLGLPPGALTRAVHNEHSWLAAQRGAITIDEHWQEVGTALGLRPDDTAALRAAFYSGDVLNVELHFFLNEKSTYADLSWYPNAARQALAIIKYFYPDKAYHMEWHDKRHDSRSVMDLRDGSVTMN